MFALKKWVVAASLATVSSAAFADITVGVSVSATGPAASLGIPERNTITLLPKSIAGQKVNYIVLDDATDTTMAVTNARKFTGEHKVDIIIGSTTVPTTLAMLDVAAETKTPLISMAAAALIVEPLDDKKRWAFKTPQNDAQMAAAIVEHMQAEGIKTVGFIGFADSYGESWHNEFKRVGEAAGIKLVANERYNRNDTSVTGQVLKIMSAKPDAVLIGAAGTPAALPHKTLKQRGYQGKYYQTHGVANNDFLRVGGKDVEGTFLPAGPVLVWDQLPESNPVKASATQYVQAYEGAYGKGTVSTFGAHAWDASRLIEAAVPAALEKAKPGSEAFREALREALENVKDVAGAHGIFSMSATDHVGLDERARVMVTITGGAWKLVK